MMGTETMETIRAIVDRPEGRTPKSVVLGIIARVHGEYDPGYCHAVLEGMVRQGLLGFFLAQSQYCVTERAREALASEEEIRND